jgi:hypothetical protein
MSVVMVNPLGPNASPAPAAPKSSSRPALKALLAFGALAVAGGVGFAVGQSMVPAAVLAPPESSGAAAGAASSKSNDTARATLSNALAAGNEVLSKLTPTDLQLTLEQYRAAPSAWQDNYLSADIMSAIDAIVREQEASQAQTQRLGQPRIGSYNTALVNTAWEKVEKEQYTGALRVGSDQVAIRRDGSTCWVIAQESNDAGDWFSNLALGTAPLLAVKQSLISHESCGCAKTTLWWCSSYKSCPGYRTVGTGYKGFAEATNSLRLGVVSAMQSTCFAAGTTATVLAGFSRGGAIVTDLAVMLLADNVVPATSLTMVTFGSPRALDPATADALHLRFPQWRMVNKEDIAPSLPYDWWGFSHVGLLRCNECNYPEERNRPFASWSFSDHGGYCSVFGDARCS